MTQSVFDFESHLMAGSLVCVFFSDRTKFPLNGCLGGQCNLGGGLRMGPKNGNSHQLSWISSGDHHNARLLRYTCGHTCGCTEPLPQESGQLWSRKQPQSRNLESIERWSIFVSGGNDGKPKVGYGYGWSHLGVLDLIPLSSYDSCMSPCTRGIMNTGQWGNGPGDWSQTSHFPSIFHLFTSSIFHHIWICIWIWIWDDMSQYLPPAISTALRILQPRHGTSCPTRAVPQPALGVQRCYGTNSLVRTYRPTTAAGRNFGWTMRVLGVLMGYVGCGLKFNGFGSFF